jgi:hypothetical protein
MKILGVDCDYVNRDKLLFDSGEFIAVDLTRAFKIPGGGADLAVCVEAAEHILGDSSHSFVHALT